MYLTHRIEETVAANTDTRAAIGAFILRERAHLADYTIADIARETHASKASVTRFAQALGFAGWREFLRSFMDEIRFEDHHEALVDVNLPFEAGASMEEVAQAIAGLHREAVDDTLRTLNRGMLELGVRHLERAKSVHVFGVSPNSYLGGLFCRKLLAIGKPATVASSGECGVRARSLTPDDLAILISYAGDNTELDPMKELPTLKSRHVPMIAITGEGTSYLRQNVRCVLTIPSREALYAKIATFATEGSIALLLDILFACYFARDYDQNLERKLRDTAVLELRRER